MATTRFDNSKDGAFLRAEAFSARLQIGYVLWRMPHKEPAPTAISPELFVKYVPPFEAIKNSLEIRAVKGELRVSASYNDFVALIKLLISVVEVDEDWYLEQNPDIAKAVQEGKLTSARRHFIDDGYMEGRLPFPLQVDEEWYLSQNPDVAESIRKGTIQSAVEHFIANGYKEGRLPFSL